MHTGIKRHKKDKDYEERSDREYGQEEITAVMAESAADFTGSRTNMMVSPCHAVRDHLD